MYDKIIRPDDDFVKTNKYRFEQMYHGMNQSHATVFLTVGLHFDHKAGQAFPVIGGAQWIDHKAAVQLLQEAIVAMNEKIIEDQKKTNA